MNEVLLDTVLKIMKIFHSIEGVWIMATFGRSQLGA